MTAEKLMERIRSADLGRYGIKGSEIVAIMDANTIDRANLCYDAYRYGFLKGQRAAKAEAKRRIERDASGWYSYLSRWLERNIGNERLLDLVGVFARKLEDNAGRRAELSRAAKCNDA